VYIVLGKVLANPMYGAMLCGSCLPKSRGLRFGATHVLEKRLCTNNNNKHTNINNKHTNNNNNNNNNNSSDDDDDDDNVLHNM
jgi:hypothetical protein